MDTPINSQRQLVGLECYVTDTPPLGGRIKSNISDFIVREILPSGEILSTFEKPNSISASNFERGKDRCTTFTLIKKNTDTIIAAKIIEKYLQVPLKHIKWNGIKDHTAITAQKFSVKGDHVKKLKQFRHQDIFLTKIRPSRRSMELGSLWGNQFTINIRNITRTYEESKEILKKWTDKINSVGFPNYYGMQRFGQHRPNSHKIGKLFFKGRYQEAVEEFLFTVYPKEYESNAIFRNELKAEQNYQEALKKCPNGLYYEKIVIEQLAIELNYKKAFLKLPISLINLILSSFQSFLFNKAISRRIKQNIPLSTPVKGDVIAILKDVKGSPSLVKYRYSGGDGWNDLNIEKAFKLDRATILAPVLGYKTELPKFPVFEEICQEILDEQNFKLLDFKQNDLRLYNFEGTNRAIFIHPTNLQVSQAYKANNYPNLDPTGIKLEFSLPKGSYATILLNELRKSS
ncbi:MAG: tRNA pseudouridine(13) synthase TruD [Promethearchaeota archaeon]